MEIFGEKVSSTDDCPAEEAGHKAISITTSSFRPTTVTLTEADTCPVFSLAAVANGTIEGAIATSSHGFLAASP